MLPILVAAMLAAPVNPNATITAPVAAQDAWPAVLYVPHPDTLRGKLKGSPLQGFTPWFATKTSARWPWIVEWSGNVTNTPVAHAGTIASSEPWVHDANVVKILAKPADVVGTLDLAHFFREGMRGTPENDRQVVRRLGVESLREAHGTAVVNDNHTVNAQVTLQVSRDNRGLIDALGPPGPSVQPAGVPPKATHWSAARVLPAKVWEVLETVAGLSAPIQYGLARAQLDVLEDSLKTRWREDVLGYAPRTWAAYELASGDHVAVLEIQKGASAAAFVRETLSTLREVFKEMTYQETKSATAVSWVVNFGRQESHVAVAADTLVIANTAAALTNHLAFHGSVKPMPDVTAPAPAVAWGVHDDARLAKRLAAWGQDGVFRAASKSVGSAPLSIKEALKYVGRSEWWMDPTPEGFGVTILARPAAANSND